ncbi:MAG: DEAD/DEAH box helicase [Firmicutes bacterium]|nr:DEAD/DEAH box helicase [Bacillota bacterium]
MQTIFSSSDAGVLASLVWEEFSSPAAFRLNQKANHLSTQAGFDRLLALEALPEITLYPHQQETVLKVLKEMCGRAVLADEVGLGKTIEAGVIMKEYLLRSLAKRILVLVPASLVTQWYEELHTNLKMPFLIQDGSVSWKEDLIISSLDYAKREPHRSRVLAQKYDLVVVDEAHKLKNNTTQNWKFVNSLQKKFLLLLTATPVQNDLKELYNIITLLKPGQLKTYREFKREFVQDKRTPRNLDKLRALLQEVMVRTNRKETMLKLPKRSVETIVVDQGDLEARFYRSTLDCLRRIYRRKDSQGENVLPLVLLAREVCSSPQAAVASLEKMARNKSLTPEEKGALKQLAQLGRKVHETGKIRRLLQFVASTEEKLIIFTEFRQTQIHLAKVLKAAGYQAVAFHGGLTLAQKDRVIAEFFREVPILISTESGGEGRNLQFCHRLLNYDLPWNPMRVEQRIGRVHRLGQRQNVQIYNLITKGSIEEYVLYLLQEKLRLFTDVVGEVETIISSAGISVEKQVADILLGTSGEKTLGALNKLANEVRESFCTYSRLQEFTDELLGVGSL